MGMLDGRRRFAPRDWTGNLIWPGSVAGRQAPPGCQVELGLFDVRRRRGLGRVDGRDVVTALPDLESAPRRRCAVGIAQIAIDEALVPAGPNNANRAGLGRYLSGFTGGTSVPA
jgi:hypothetical protein